MFYLKPLDVNYFNHFHIFQVYLLPEINLL